MPELRKDPILNRWIIFAPERSKRPTDFVAHKKPHKSSHCPFCEGNEKETPPEVYSIRRPDSNPDSPGWQVRVVTNKFPALSPDEKNHPLGGGIYEKRGGYGAHEVIIETPKHGLELEDQSEEEVQQVFDTYQLRLIEILKDPDLVYPLIFKNVGFEAGASLEHPHSQLIATPILPKRIQEKLDGIKAYQHQYKKCLFCEITLQEQVDKKRLIYENEGFVAFCPYASRFPYEIMIIPKRHHVHFQEIEIEEMKLFAKCVKVTLTKLTKALKKPQYNYVLNTGPRTGDFHWHLEIMPRVIRIAGFEWGSDFFINPVVPEEAAIALQKA